MEISSRVIVLKPNGLSLEQKRRFTMIDSFVPLKPERYIFKGIGHSFKDARQTIRLGSKNRGLLQYPSSEVP